MRKFFFVFLLCSGQAFAAPPSTGTVTPVGWVNGTRYMKCDGVTDDTTGLQNAVNDAANGTLMLPKGICNISATIVITSTIHIIGAGGGSNQLFAGTTLEWVGASTTTPMIDLQGVRDASFQDFLIETTSANPLAIGIQSTTISGKQSGKDQFYRIFMNGTSTGLGKGYAFVVGSGGDNNNDQATFIDNIIANYTIAGWSFEGGESQNHKMINCSFLGWNAGHATLPNQYGVTTILGASNGGNFAWIGGYGCCNGGADFFLGAPRNTISIENADFESSDRFLVTTGSTGNAWPILIEATRWAGNALDSDGIAINYGLAGTLTLIGNLIGDAGVTDSAALQIGLASGATHIAAVAIGNWVNTSLANPFTQLFGNTTGVWTLLGNKVGYPTITQPLNTLMSNQQAVTIANLPACNIGSVGAHASVSNGQTSPPFNGAVSTTGAVYAPVGCVQTGASSYGWVYQ